MPDDRIARWADLIAAKTITPEEIPVYDRNSVQEELVRRYVLRLALRHGVAIPSRRTA